MGFKRYWDEVEEDIQKRLPKYLVVKMSSYIADTSGQSQPRYRIAFELDPCLAQFFCAES
jgi:hypothetical protein